MTHLDATDHRRDDSHPNVGCHSFPGDQSDVTVDSCWAPFGFVEKIRRKNACFSYQGCKLIQV